MYCTQADLYSKGSLPRGALRNPGRLLSGVDTSADTLELGEHGLADGVAVELRAEGDGSLPNPLTAGTTYYVVNAEDNRFQVSATQGGAAVDLTTTGDRTIVIGKLPKDEAIAEASALIDDMLPAHVVPLTAPYPEIVRVTCAQLAVAILLTATGGSSEALGKTLDYAQKRLERWSKGVPIRGTNHPTSANLSAGSSSLVSTSANPWRTYGGTR